MPDILIASLINHLWQSTVVVAIAWPLAWVLRKNHARTRYWVWFAASMKFLLPFSLLMTAGEWMRSFFAMPIVAKPAIANAMEQIAQPFPQAQFFDAAQAPVTAHHGDLLSAVLLAIWICGVVFVAVRFGRGWLRVYAAKRAARPLALAADVPVLCSSSLIEPGNFGIFRPELLLPEGILERLTPEQLQAIIAHEICHVRQRDNLTFAIHMIVEALFWFHPAVWWVGARLVEERERACDEAVLQSGNGAETYAEGILNVCKFYVESPLECVAGVTGSDLKQRIVRVMTGAPAKKLSLSRKVLVAVMGTVAFSAPLIAGLIVAARISAQLLQSNGPRPSFEVATIKPSLSSVYDLSLAEERFTAQGFSLDRMVRFAYNVKTGNQIENLPTRAGAEKFDINAKVADALLKKMKDLAPELRFEQYQLMLQSLLADRFNLKVTTKTKKLPVYALVVAKSGLKLTPAEVPTDPRDLRYGELVANNAKGDLKATGVSTARLAQWLSGTPEAGERAVIDETGLTGRYDFTLKWAPIEGAASAVTGPGASEPTASAPTIDQGEPSLFSALPEQLGLKLVPTNAQVEVLVIDHVEQPSPN